MSTSCYFNESKDTQIQTDASLKGLGAWLMQDDHPVSFASKILITAERNYSNIEMLGVVFSLGRFHHYTYERLMNVITDHKPLEAISKKSLSNSPPRLQRILLKIQHYVSRVLPRFDAYISLYAATSANRNARDESDR